MSPKSRLSHAVACHGNAPSSILRDPKKAWSEKGIKALHRYIYPDNHIQQAHKFKCNDVMP
jgi:hypothetical protein